MATDQLMSYKNNIVSKKDNCIWINLCFIFMVNSTIFFRVPWMVRIFFWNLSHSLEGTKTKKVIKPETAAELNVMNAEKWKNYWYKMKNGSSLIGQNLISLI